MHRPQDVEKVLRKFPIEDVWGIGRRSSAKLHSIGIKSAYDFTLLPEGTVRRMFGLNGLRTWKELKGEACIEFEDGFEAKQSICVSRSFSKEISDVEAISEQVANFASSMAEKLRKQRSVACEMTVFAYTNRFKEDAPQAYVTQLVSFSNPTNDQRVIVTSAVAALKDIFRGGFGYKKAGVVATHILADDDVVPSLFEDSKTLEKDHKITAALDAINGSFGKGTVKFAVQGSGQILSSSENQSPHYTTLWEDIPCVFVR
jgi:DNA polymerase V